MRFKQRNNYLKEVFIFMKTVIDFAFVQKQLQNMFQCMSNPQEQIPYLLLTYSSENFCRDIFSLKLYEQLFSSGYLPTREWKKHDLAIFQDLKNNVQPSVLFELKMNDIWYIYQTIQMKTAERFKHPWCNFPGTSSWQHISRDLYKMEQSLRAISTSNKKGYIVYFCSHYWGLPNFPHKYKDIIAGYDGKNKWLTQQSQVSDIVSFNQSLYKEIKEHIYNLLEERRKQTLYKYELEFLYLQNGYCFGSDVELSAYVIEVTLND
jgi:hypothetical protein